MTPEVRSSLRSHAAYFGSWMLLAFFFSSQDMLRAGLMGDRTTPRWHYVVAWVAGFLVAGSLGLIALWLGRRFPLGRKHWFRRVLLHGFASVLYAIADMLLVATILPRLGILPGLPRDFTSVLGFLIIMSSHQLVITYWSLLAFQYGIRTYHKYQEREREALRLELNASELKTQLVRSQLNALKGQLQPHFLFNTLNAIMVLVRQEKGKQAEQMLGGLSDLLRCVLEDVDTQVVSLRRELEYVRLYLAIEQVRFQDRMAVTIDADPAILDAAVPHMVLQPIVENAIHHGIGRRSAAGRISIMARSVEDTVVLQVRDDGPGLESNGTRPGRGIGLTNTRARLQQLYGGAARLTLEDAPTGGVLATIVIPYNVSADDRAPEMMELHAFHNASGG